MSAITLRPKTTWLLIRNGLSVARTPAILIAAGSGVAFILYVLTSIGGGSNTFHLVVYPIMLVLFGYIVSSFAFQEIHDSRAGVYELTSPGSILEKYVAKILLTSIGWAIAVTIAYILTTVLGAGVSQLIFGESHGIFLPRERVIWETIGSYLVSQSIFVFGSIYFKKSAFLKTILVTVLLSIIFAIFFAVAWRVIYWGEFARILPSEAEMNAFVNAFGENGVLRLVRTGEIMNVISWIVVPLFFWLAGYVRLRETEV
jgi:hypothetical protein